MRLFRITKREFAEDLSGQGAFLYGGRWNYKGRRMLYASENASLALLENLVHLQGFRILPDLVLVEMEFEPTRTENLSVPDLPDDWRKNPGPDALKELGSDFLDDMKFPALVVPSVVMPRDNNVLINPLHPESAGIKIVRTEKFSPEGRLFL
jgi:RES domain-containing protein